MDQVSPQADQDHRLETAEVGTSWQCLPEPDSANPPDLVVVRKTDVEGVDAQAVGPYVVAERIVTGDAGYRWTT